VVLIQLVKLRPQRRIDFLDLREIKLPYLGLIRNRQRTVQRPCRSSVPARRPVDRIHRENRIQVADSNLAAVEFLQVLRDPVRCERFLHCGFQVAELALFLDLDGALFEHHSTYTLRSLAKSARDFGCGLPLRSRPQNASTLERETGIEPATNSLEGCDSTTELLPLSRTPGRDAACRVSDGASPFSTANMEPMIRIELMTSPLPRECSTN